MNLDKIDDPQGSLMPLCVIHPTLLLESFRKIAVDVVNLFCGVTQVIT